MAFGQGLVPWIVNVRIGNSALRNRGGEQAEGSMIDLRKSKELILTKNEEVNFQRRAS